MSKPFARPLVAAMLAGMLLGMPVSPAFGQNPPQEAPSTPAQQTAQPQQPEQQPAQPAMAPVSLGVAKYDFSKGPRAFPNILNPYKPISIAQPVLTNSPKIEQMIQDRKSTRLNSSHMSISYAV